MNTTVNSCPNLTPAEIERLAMLAEKCGDVVHIVGKILRHGYNSFNPDADHDISNGTALEEALGRLLGVADMMSAEEDLDIDYVDRVVVAYRREMRRYLHHQTFED